MFQGFIQSAHASFKLEALKDLYTVRVKRSPHSTSPSASALRGNLSPCA